MKKMIMLSLVVSAIFDGVAFGSGGKEAQEHQDIKKLIEDWNPLSFTHIDLNYVNEENDKKSPPPVIKKLKETWKKFNCAFTPQENINTMWGTGWMTEFARSIVRGHSTKAIKEFDDIKNGIQQRNLQSQESSSEEGKQRTCPLGEISFTEGWSPLKSLPPLKAGEKRTPNLENIVRILKFDIDTKEDGTALAGKNIKSGLFYSLTGRKVTLGWFGLAPLKENINKNNNRWRGSNRDDRSSYESIAEMGGLLDCNASGLLCNKSDNFFRRLKGCSMRSLYQSGGVGGCLQVAAKSDWVRDIVIINNEIDTFGDTTRNARSKAIAQIAHRIVWTFVLAELLERHDARRYRNNVVRGLVGELEKQKNKKFKEVVTFLTKVSDAATDADKSEQKQEKIKREISLAFETVYQDAIPKKLEGDTGAGN